MMTWVSPDSLTGVSTGVSCGIETRDVWHVMLGLRCWDAVAMMGTLPGRIRVDSDEC